MRDIRDQPYYLQEPRPSYRNPHDYRESLLIMIDRALDTKDKEWFMELTDRLERAN